MLFMCRFHLARIIAFLHVQQWVFSAVLVMGSPGLLIVAGGLYALWDSGRCWGRFGSRSGCGGARRGLR